MSYSTTAGQKAVTEDKKIPDEPGTRIVHRTVDSRDRKAYFDRVETYTISFFNEQLQPYPEYQRSVPLIK